MYFPVLVPEHVEHVLQELCHQGLGHQGLVLEQVCHIELLVLGLGPNISQFVKLDPNGSGLVPIGSV